MLKRYKSLPSNDAARLETNAWVSRGNTLAQQRDGHGFIRRKPQDYEMAANYDIDAALAMAKADLAARS